jgi:hypothetical protein
VAVEVAAGAVVVLGRSRVGVPGEDLCVAEGYAGVEGVGDRCMTQRVWADVARYPGGFGDPHHHPGGVASVDGLPGERPQHEESFGPVPVAGRPRRCAGRGP